jgi:hypothetical protein
MKKWQVGGMVPLVLTMMTFPLLGCPTSLALPLHQQRSYSKGFEYARLRPFNSLGTRA